LGVDIAKLTLDLRPHPLLRKRTYPINPKGHAALLAAMAKLAPPVHVVCEATGGYEQNLLATLQQAHLPVSLLNPRRARDFARAKGLLAKTDRLDAAVLAEYGRVLQPAPTPARSPTQKRLT